MVHWPSCKCNWKFSSFIYLLVQPIGNGSSGWFIDDTQDIEARDCASILSGLALGVVEVGGYRNYSIVDSLEGNKKKISITSYNFIFGVVSRAMLSNILFRGRLQQSPSSLSAPWKRSLLGRRFWFHLCIQLPLWDVHCHWLYWTASASCQTELLGPQIVYQSNV